MKIIQSLMVMMTVMVCGASPHLHNDPLGEIYDKAKEMCENAPLDVRITNPSGNSGSTCVIHFFCLAEKALKNISNEHKVHANKLIRALEIYNQQKMDKDCVLNSSEEYNLGSFLKAVMKCSSHCSVTHKKKKIECKRIKHKQ